jgi:ribosomal protein S8E
MAIRITHIHLVGGTAHQHINNLKWVNVTTAKTGESTRAAIVDWLEKDTNNRAQVGTGTDAVRVHVVRPSSGVPYLQTYADGKWTNNLLALPRY